MSENFAPNFPKLKYKQLAQPQTNYFQNPTQYLTQATAKILNSTSNKKTSTSAESFPINMQYKIIILLEYKTMNARSSSGASCQNWQKTEG